MATTKARPKCTNHDFIAPKGETLDSEARCASCGAAPKERDGSPAIRYVEPDVWFDAMVKLG